mmetsp:Transcript_275/g.1161  ORF Transcript_275/g.1161 Transcript_275/m.1161 type:complete len:202 (+) Transcript_275:1033-1638(+)
MSGMYASPELKSIHQLRVVIDGVNELGICNVSSPEIPLRYAVTEAMITATARPKSAVTSRIVAFMYGELRSCTAHNPSCNVINPNIKLKSAVAVEYVSSPRYSNKFFNPSKMKMAHTKRLKISCVNFVHRVATYAHASDTAIIIINILVHTPTHANVGKKSIFHESHRLNSSIRNTVCGPAGRRTISGCPAKTAHAMPLSA